MNKIRGSKWNRRICKWIASLLTVALLVNQSSLSVLAEEISEEVCQCDTRCSADSVNEGCPVCAQDYGRCEGAEDVSDTDTGEETENPGTGEGVDTGTGEETENPDAGTDTDTDEETEDPDADESNTNADKEDVSDMDGETEGDASLQEEVARNVAEGDAVSRVLEEPTFDYEEFTYRIISEDDLQVEVIKHEDGTSVSGDLVIPFTVSDGTNWYTVVGIYGAFWGCGNLTGVTIPNSVTSIGDWAFWGCSSLTSITIPDSVTSIGGWAFRDCDSLTSITIPDSVTSIKGGAFLDCSNLESVTIPNSVTSIADRVFQSCSSLESITIPDSVTSIEVDTFAWCSSLKSVTIPDSVTSIGNNAFYLCGSLENIIIPGEVTRIGETAFRDCSSLESVTVLNDKMVIAMQAFSRCTSLNCFQIALTDSIAVTPPEVGNYVFFGCDPNRSLSFLTEDGTTELSETTTPKLSTAVEAYDVADGIVDDMWYGWKLPEVSTATTYPVTIKVNKDGSTWSDCGKTFALSTDGVNFITVFTAVPAGTYTIYETTGATNSAAYVDTRVTVEVTDSDVEATVNYYTVTFYDGDTPLGESQIVLNNTTVSAPSPSPVKDGYTLSWVTYNADGSSTEFDLNDPITATTDIYASWTKAEEKTFTITASAGTGGSVTPSGTVTVNSGANQRFTITPDEGYRVSSVLVDGVEQLNSTQASDHSRAGITDAGNGVIHYDFENVTSNHTLTAAFAATSTGGDSGGSDGGDTGGGSDNSGGDSAGSSSPDGSGKSATAAHSDKSAKNGTNVISVSNTAPASEDSEPKTGDASHMEIYATLAMIAGLSYILLYFADGKNGMTEEEKKEIVAALVAWAKNGSRVKKYAALAVIFLILVYYHSIGKRTTVDWKEVYER